MARIRGVVRRSTGGKAPRKQLSHAALMQFERRHPLLRDNFVSDKEVQTFPSNSDVQIQMSAETNTVGTQTDQENQDVELQREHNVARDIVAYLEDELRVLRRKLERAEAKQKKLEGKPTSTCSKDCCRKNL